MDFWRSVVRRLPGSWQIANGQALALGKIAAADLPTCNHSRDGEKRAIPGAAGVADREVICSKDAADAYAWNDTIISGLDARYVNVTGDSITGALDEQVTTSAGTAQSITRAGNDAFGAFVTFRKSRNATPGSHTIVSSGDELGYISFQGSDGTNYDEAARITASVSTTPSAGTDMPGKLDFGTSPDGSATITSRMTIDHAGLVTITGEGRVSSPGTNSASMVTVGGTQTLTNKTLTNPAIDTPTITTAVVTSGAVDSQVSGLAGTAYTVTRYSNDAFGAFIKFQKTRNAAAGSHTIVSSGDELGYIGFYGSDGTNYDEAARITASVGTTPSSGTDMPGNLAFATSPDASATIVDRAKIFYDGGLAIQDGITAPATHSGWAVIYVDTADGDLKVKFGDGTVKTIVVDT